MKKIGIVFAMQEELKEFMKLTKYVKEINIYNLTIYEVLLDKHTCFLVESGVGKVNASRATQVLIDKLNIECIINIGVAGAISDKLNLCDIVVGESLVQHDFDITAFDHEKGYIPNIGVYLESDKYLVDIAMDCKDKINTKVIKGIIASGDIFCTETKMSEKINKKFNALCVEMEGAAIAQAAFLSSIPFLVLRSISDVLNEENVMTYDKFLEKSSKEVAQYLKIILMVLNEK